MLTNQHLYEYLEDNAHSLADNWIEALDQGDKDDLSVIYTTALIRAIQTKNNELNGLLARTFTEDAASFQKDLDNWLRTISTEIEYLQTPIHFIISAFYRLQGNYIEAINTFYQSNCTSYSAEDLYAWTTSIYTHMEKIILAFLEKQQQFAEKRLCSQQAMINELSSPVIALTEYTSILPLMGYLDTERGTNFADNVLDQCVEKQISCLMIDLSAVTLVNTNLAQKLFTLLDMLHLVGIDTVLSGVRPEIAQTAVQLGIDFDGITIKATLAHAIHDRYAELGYL